MTKLSEARPPHFGLTESAAPSTPASGEFEIYAATDGTLHTLNDAGVDTELGGGGGGRNATADGRLTLETGVAISTSDQSAKTTLYYTPFHGNQIGTYTDSAWQIQTFTEKSLSLSGLTADTNYDIYIEDSDLSLSAVAWTNDTTRATALVLQDGVNVKTGDVSKRYLGTIRINSTGGQCEDTLTQRFVWNAHNRVRRPMRATDTTNSWTYGTSAWRAANNTTTNHQISYVAGLSEDLITAELQCMVYGNGGTDRGGVGIGLDSTTTNSAQIRNRGGSGSVVVVDPAVALYEGYPGIGYHYLVWIEYRLLGTVTYYGDNGEAVLQSGLRGAVQG